MHFFHHLTFHQLQAYWHQGPYNPTWTSMKTSLKNRLSILLNVFAIIPIRPVT